MRSRLHAGALALVRNIVEGDVARQVLVAVSDEPIDRLAREGADPLVLVKAGSMCAWVRQMKLHGGLDACADVKIPESHSVRLTHHFDFPVEAHPGVVAEQTRIVGAFLRSQGEEVSAQDEDWVKRKLAKEMRVKGTFKLFLRKGSRPSESLDILRQRWRLQG